MFKGIGYQLIKIANADYDGNKSAMARDFDKSPQLMYQYTKAERSPGADFLKLLHEKGYNINWVLSNEGDMHIKSITAQKADQPVVEDYIKEKGVTKMLNLIIKRLAEVDYNEEVKMKILKETLNKIVIAQNDHFVETELNKK